MTTKKPFILFLLIFCTISISPLASAKQLEQKSTKQSVEASKITQPFLSQYETKIAQIKKKLSESPRLSINGLNLFRERIEFIQTNITKNEENYKKKLDKINGVMSDFAKIKNEKPSEFNLLDQKYQKIYKEKINEFTAQIGFLQNRLFQIKLMRYEINNILDSIKSKQIELRNGSIFSSSNPLYLSSTWSLAIHSLASHTERLLLQLSETKNKIYSAYHNLKTWSYTAILVIFFTIYLKLIWPKRFIETKKEKQYRALFHLLSRGIIPIIFLCGLYQLISSIMAPAPPVIMIGFLRSILNALSFVFIGITCINIYFSYILSDSNKKIQIHIKKHIKRLVFIIAAILFINNMLFFSIDSYPYPFYPGSSVTLINFIFSIILFFSLISITNKITKISQENQCD